MLVSNRYVLLFNISLFVHLFKLFNHAHTQLMFEHAPSIPRSSLRRKGMDELFVSWRWTIIKSKKKEEKRQPLVNKMKMIVEI